MPNKIAITGLCCRALTAQQEVIDLQGFWQLLTKPQNIDLDKINSDRALVIKLAQDALNNALPNKEIIDERLGIIINGQLLSKICTGPDIKLEDALSLEFDISEHRDYLHSGISKGFNIAFEQLNSKQIDIAVAIFLEQKSAVALVLRRIEDAITKKEQIYAVPVVFHEEQNRENNNHLTKLYSDLIKDRSVDLLTISTPSLSVIESEIKQLSQLFENLKDKKTSANRPWCALKKSISSSHSDLPAGLLLTQIILSLQQKALLPEMPQTATDGTNLPMPFYVNASLRPWFFPQINKQLALLNPALNERSELSGQRCAAFHLIDNRGHTFHLVLEECGDTSESKKEDLKSNWESELFTFSCADKQQLYNYVQSIKQYLSTSAADLKDLAFTVNTWSTKQFSLPIKAAFVCTSIEHLTYKLDQLAQYCLNKHISEGLYFNELSPTATEIAQGGLAYVLPGLGAAYPNMLLELCLHFPEVRAIFDFVDYIALSAAIRPSERIFPRRSFQTKPSSESPATLAMMDSAVVTVLMAEWAIFTLLLNLGITPDVLLGCSTGEFAALTMSGAIDILGAAPLFYHLSTGISKALPFNRLVNLRSLKIMAPYQKIEQYLSIYTEKIHLSADLSDSQVLVTGDKDSINVLAKTLEENNIIADFLPFAIPYHTSLVEDVVSPQDPDVVALQIDKPLIESWSCSLVDKYPSQPDAIRKISTELFSKPILFKDSIEALYARGMRKFVEVGPRGNLSTLISETLNEKPHISIAADRSDLSSITQLHHTLAELFVNDVCIDLLYLYKRRKPVLLSVFDQLTNYFPPEEKESDYFETSSNDFEAQSINHFRQRLLELEQQTISSLKACHSTSAATKKWQKYLHDPEPTFLSKKIHLPNLFDHLKHMANNSIVCRKLEGKDLPLDSKLLLELASCTLTSSEISIFKSFQQDHKRKEWLGGRLTIKEAVRSFLYDNYHFALNNIEIEIDSLDAGKIYLRHVNTDHPYPVISLSHKNGKVIAVAADSSLYSSIGIDIESSEPVDTDLIELILSAQEKQYLQNLTVKQKSDTFKKIWAAKEAVAKVLGLGLADYLKTLPIIDHSNNFSQFVIEPTNQDNVHTNRLKSYVLPIEDGIISLSYITTSNTTTERIT